MPKRELKGIVISNKMQKTLVVRVESIKEHPKYKRRYKFHKNYKAHYDPSAGGGEYKEGDRVVIQETKPISKDKHWKIIKKI
ncbi:MAG: 30S ribosomal protein S17 [bacterium]|nr:30S ribosomal protein S17 [bacterium]